MKQERLNVIGDALDKIAELISATVDDIRMDMANKVNAISSIKEELKEDVGEMLLIANAVEGFASDMNEQVGEIDNSLGKVKAVTVALDDISADLFGEDVEEEDDDADYDEEEDTDYEEEETVDED